MTRVRLAFAAALLVAAAPVSAQNLVTNPEFTSSLTGWAQSFQPPSGAVYGGSTGSTELGAAILTATPGAARVAARRPYARRGGAPYVNLYQCVGPVAPGLYELKAHTYTAQSSGDSFNEVSVVFWDDAACDGNLLDAVATSTNAPVAGISPTNWTERSATNIVIPFGTMGVSVEMYVDSGTSQSPSTVYFDHVSFGLVPTPVALQSFNAE